MEDAKFDIWLKNDIEAILTKCIHGQKNHP